MDRCIKVVGIVSASVMICALYLRRRKPSQDGFEDATIPYVITRRPKVAIPILESEEVTGLDGNRLFSSTELSRYRGRNGDPWLPGNEGGSNILVSLFGNIYHVPEKLYGPGENYHKLAGKDVTRILGKMVLDDEAVAAESNADWETNFSQAHRDRAMQWEQTFTSKYKRVGIIDPGERRTFFVQKALLLEP